MKWTDQSGEVIRDFAVREAMKLDAAELETPRIGHRAVREAAEANGLRFVSRSHGEATTGTVSLDTLVSVARMAASFPDTPR